MARALGGLFRFRRLSAALTHQPLGVHLVGWLRKTQPKLQTLELPGFCVLTALAVWLRVAA